MVSVSHLQLAPRPGHDRIAGWLAEFGVDYAAEDIALLRRVPEWMAPQAGEALLKSGERLLSHALDAALILRAFKLDAECVAASLLAHVATTPDADGK